MKRLIFILFLAFCTVNIFANEKTENLPETENAVPDFSIENEQREIWRQERLERRREKRGLKRTAEYKMLKSSLIVFGAVTTSVFSVPATILTVGYIYHVMIPLGYTAAISFSSGFNAASPYDWSFALAYSFLLLIAGVPVILSLSSVALGIGLSAGYGKYYKTRRVENFNEENFSNAANQLSKIFRNIAISCGIFGTLFIPMLAGGFGIIGGIQSGAISVDTSYLNTGVILASLGAVFTSSCFSLMFGALGAMAWLKGEMNRFSVDIGVTSGNKGELSCDRSRRQQVTPNGAAIALCVKF